MFGDLTRTLPTRERFARIREERDSLFEAAELAQAAIDREFEQRECVDAMTPLHRDALALVRAAAAHEDVQRHLDALARHDLPPTLSARIPEGFAFYGVQPESYARIARDFPDATVVGIRTIGIALGAVVAAASNARDFITVRPTGHPFDRRIDIDFTFPDDGTFLVVDEGPGLSGSSFIAVAEQLAPRRVVLLPSHANGPGARADARIRSLWERTEKVHVLSDSREGTFIGLGPYGRDKLAKARRLASLGLAPRVVGYANGYITYERMEGTIARDLDAVERYLLALEPAPSWRSGRLPSELCAPEWKDVAARLDLAAEPVDGDNAMHARNWIATRDGRVLKLDAVNGSLAHDGIGVQDLAWDIAGAIVELQLNDAEAARLRRCAPRRTDEEIAFYRACYERLRK